MLMYVVRTPSVPDWDRDGNLTLPYLTNIMPESGWVLAETQRMMLYYWTFISIIANRGRHAGILMRIGIAAHVEASYLVAYCGLL